MSKFNAGQKTLIKLAVVLALLFLAYSVVGCDGLSTPEDASPDAQTKLIPDAGRDSSVDSQGDSVGSVDTGVDVGSMETQKIDASDAGNDVQIDTGIDVGVDLGVDTGIEAGDAGIDAGVDSADAETEDAGCPTYGSCFPVAGGGVCAPESFVIHSICGDLSQAICTWTEGTPNASTLQVWGCMPKADVTCVQKCPDGSTD